MNLTKLATIIVAALLAANAAFGQTVQITGTVTELTDAQVTLICGMDTWLITRDATTSDERNAGRWKRGNREVRFSRRAEGAGLRRSAEERIAAPKQLFSKVLE